MAEVLVLVELNPPLNLEGRPASDIRTALTHLRVGGSDELNQLRVQRRQIADCRNGRQ